MAERRLIALAEQIEQRRALREVVIRVGRAAALARAAPPRSRRYSPHAAGATRGSSAIGRGREPLLGLRQPVRRRSALRRRSASPAARRTAARRPAGSRRRSATASSSAPRRSASRAPSTRTDHSYQWLVCAAVRAVGVAGAAEKVGRACRSGRESGESARACRRPRRSSRETGSGCGRRARGAARLRRASRSPRRTQIWPSVASATARPCPEPCAS